MLPRKTDDRKLADFVLGLVARTYRRRLDRFFRGTIATVAGPTANGYLVTVTPTEGGGTIQLSCAITGYVPVVGDVVECMWRDESVGYVLWPLSRQIALATVATVRTLIQTQTVANVSSLTFSAIPTGFKHLALIWRARSDQVGAQVVGMQFNGDAGANYDFVGFSVTNVTTGGFNTPGGTSLRVGVAAPSGAGAGAQGGYDVTIMDYRSSTARRNYRWAGGRFDVDNAANANAENGAGQWRNSVDPITSLKLLPGAGVISGVFTLLGDPG